MSGPEAVSYTAFKAEVTNKNVKEIFARGDTIQGALKKAVPLPDQQDRTYDKFTTERPTFATDDLLAELMAGEAIVRAKPLVQERGVLTNLLFSIGPMLLLFGFYFWMFRRQQSAMGGGILGGSRTKAGRSGNRAGHVRRCRRHRRGRGRDQRGGGLPARPREVPASRRSRAERRAAHRGARDRQDTAGQGDRRRGEGAVLQRQRLRVHRDDRGRRRQPRPRALCRGPQSRPGHHLHR